MECVVIGQKISSRVHRGREDGVVGSLAGGRESLKAIGRAFGKPYLPFIFCWRRTLGFGLATAAVEVGIDALGARGDIQRYSGQSIDTIDAVLRRIPVALRNEIDMRVERAA
jgi:hypothetical protein